jgi:TonB family protein
VSPLFLHLDDTRPEPEQIERAVNLRDAVVLSVGVHVLFVVLLLWLPTLPWVQHLLAMQEVPQTVPVQPHVERPNEPFVMVEPKIDREALRKLTRPAPMSDLDREARSRERNPNATNNQPFLRGRSTELAEAQPRSEKPKGQGPSPEPSPPAPQTPPAPDPAAQAAANAPQVAMNNASTLPRPQTQPQPNQQTGARSAPPPGGALGEALKNLNKYAQDQQLDNPNGGNQVDPAIQFDSKGVEFGPWLRRFIAQVKRNWFVPYAAMSLKGHVVITFNVHKDGRITDLQVLRPSDVSAFNNAAFNALAQSNPTMALPTEYPTDKAFFTVTFYYNESPYR